MSLCWSALLNVHKNRHVMSVLHICAPSYCTYFINFLFLFGHINLNFLHMNSELYQDVFITFDCSIIRKLCFEIKTHPKCEYSEYTIICDNWFYFILSFFRYTNVWRGLKPVAETCNLNHFLNYTPIFCVM